MWLALMGIVRQTVKIGFVLSMIFAFVIVLNIIISTLAVGVNHGVLADIFAMIQMWLPFNLNVVLLWLLTAATLYIGYRLTVVAIHFLDVVVR